MPNNHLSKIDHVAIRNSYRNKSNRFWPLTSHNSYFYFIKKEIKVHLGTEN